MAPIAASLFKNAIALEQAAKLNTVVLDKTGTLTRGEPEGEPEVVAITTAYGISEDDVLRLVAAAERESEHSLADATVAASENVGSRWQDWSASRSPQVTTPWQPSKASDRNRRH